MAHVGHLDGAEQGVLEHGVAGGAVHGVHGAGDIGGDDVLLIPRQGLDLLLLEPDLLCLLLVLAGGCGKSSAADSTQKEKEQELQKIEAAADNPAEADFDDQQDNLADENGDSYDPESDYGGDENGEYEDSEGNSSEDDQDRNDASKYEDQYSGNGEIDKNGVYTTRDDVALYECGRYERILVGRF